MTGADGRDDPLEEQPEPVVERVQLAYGLVALLIMRSAPLARKTLAAPKVDDPERLPYAPPPWL